MSLPLSREVGSVLDLAKQIAGTKRGSISTAHLLLALLEEPNQATQLLQDREISATRIKGAMKGLGQEPGQVLENVWGRSERLAKGARSEAITSLHVLAALVREPLSQAYTLLEGCGVDIGAIRATVMSYATSSRPTPRRYRNYDAILESGRVENLKGQEEEENSSPSPIGFHPSLGVGRRRSREIEPESLSMESSVVEEQATSPRTVQKREPIRRKERPRTSRDSGAIEALLQTGGGLALDNHPGINRGGKPRPNQPKHSEETEAERQAEALDDARQTTQDLAKRLFAKKALQEAQEAQEIAEKEHESRLTEELEKAKQKAKEESTPAVLLEGDEELAQEYELDGDDYPLLKKFGRNLTVDAALGLIDSVVGRESEIAQLIDILGKRRSNNPLLVGEPGVGKTAIVEGLACKMVALARKGSPFGKRKIIELEMGRILSGTHLRGAFSERLLGIKDEVAAGEGDVIVFLDEIHTWIGAGTGGDGGDAAGELKTALARGKFPCIGATTHDECRRFVESDPAFERRFQKVTVDEPDEETAMKIVDGVREHYERHHGVAFSADAVAAAVSLSVRYVHDRQLPDKAIGILDLAGSRASRKGIVEVRREDVARVVADVAGLPADRLTGSEGARFLEMETFLSAGVIGHREVVERIAELLRRNYAGFRSQRPIGSLLFLGPTGVGKTEMVKVLADFLFHDRDAIIRLDMSEFMEAHSVSRLIGAPPGYVGHDQGGQLTEAVRKRPYQVVLFDEIEKAHHDVLNLLLQLFEEGRLTDGRGRQVDFSNALVVMTSNLGAEVFQKESRRNSGSIGFSSAFSPERESDRNRQQLQEEALESAQRHFTPELWNRIDERLVFLPLRRDEVVRIAALQLADSTRRLFEESQIDMVVHPDVVEYLIANGGYDKKFGARPMRQTIQRLVEGAVAREILSGAVKRGGRIEVAVEGAEIVVFSE